MSDDNYNSRRRQILKLGLGSSVVGLAGCVSLLNSDASTDGSDPGGGPSEAEGENTRPEIISEINISNPSTGQVQISVSSTESLESLQVEISGPNSTTLSKDDFDYSTPDGSYTYKTTYEIESTGEYTATVLEVTDSLDDPGATGAEASVTIGEEGVPQPIQIGLRQEPNPSQHETPSPPEPDWVVASDGSGDYETIEEVLEIIKDGDVIEVKPGEYTVSGTSFGALVGAGRDETVINVDKSDIGSGFSVHNATLQSSNSVVVNSLIKFYNCNVEFAVSSYTKTTPSAMIDAVKTDFQQTIEASSLDVRGCTFNKIEFDQGGSLDRKSVCKLTDCVINGQFVGYSVGTGASTRCEFNQQAVIDGLNAEDTSFSSGLIGGNTVSNCKIEPGVNFFNSALQSSVDSGPYAVMGGKNLEKSIVTGKISNKINKIRGCKITNVTQGTWNRADEIINQTAGGRKIANEITYTAFIDGRLQIDSPESGRSPPSLDHNYYSSFDGSDTNGDGIIDKPYPLPGSAEVVDRNPLNSQDIQGYLEKERSSS